MERELFNALPLWAFLPLFVVFMSCITALIFVGIKKFFPHSFHGQKNTFLYILIEVVGVNYAFLLGFIVITLWTDFDNIKKVTAMEANHLSLMTINSSIFPQPVKNELLKAIGQYVHDVTHDEWETMKWGQPSQKAFESYQAIIRQIQTYNPHSETEKLFYIQFIKDLNEAYGNRRLRLTSLHSSLIPALLFILFFDSILIVTFISLIENKKYNVHLILTLALGWILFFNIGLALLFEYPFSTNLVSREPFFQGFLMRFKES